MLFRYIEPCYASSAATGLRLGPPQTAANPTDIPTPPIATASTSVGAPSSTRIGVRPTPARMPARRSDQLIPATPRASAWPPLRSQQTAPGVQYLAWLISSSIRPTLVAAGYNP